MPDYLKAIESYGKSYRYCIKTATENVFCWWSEKHGKWLCKVVQNDGSTKTTYYKAHEDFEVIIKNSLASLDYHAVHGVEALLLVIKGRLLKFSGLTKKREGINV